MEARESKLRSVLSWADEVEKEEEEAHVVEKQKPNPFGCARPREVVLQEREAHHCQYLPKSPPPHPIFREVGHKRGNVPQFLSIFHHPESAIFDPPLKYPPKNVVAAALFFNSTNQSKNGHFQEQNNIEAEKENTNVHNQTQMQLLKRPENGANSGKPAVGEEVEQQQQQQKGFQRKKGFRENERKWKKENKIHHDQPHMQLLKKPEIGFNSGKPAVGEEAEDHLIGFQKKGFQENERKWRKKDENARKRRRPLAEQNGQDGLLLHQNEPNQKKSGFQEIHRGAYKRRVGDNKRSEASNVKKTKQTWMRTTEANGMKS